MNAAGTGRRASIKGSRCRRQDGHRAGHFERWRVAPRQGRPRTCATTGGSCSSRLGITRKSPASSSSSMGCTAPTRRDVAHHVLDTFFAKREAAHAASATPPAKIYVLTFPIRWHGAAPGPTEAGAANAFERRLYYHVDWALLLAILALCGLGVAMIYSSTCDPTSWLVAHVRHAAYAIATRSRRRWSSRLTLDYRTFHRQVPSHLHRSAGVCFCTCSVFGAVAMRCPPLDSLWERSISNHRSLPRSAWPWCWPSSSARTAHADLD